VSKPINIAVIGCGYWGPNLIRNFNSLPDECRVVLVCDASQDRLQHIKRLFPKAETVTSPDPVFERPDIDAVAVATPIRTHFELASRSLQAGKHTFVEKPLAASTDECRELMALAETNDRILMVGHTFIYTPDVRHIRAMIENGDLGDILCIGSNRLNLGLIQKDINVAWDLAPHDISIIQYILQDYPVAVNCQGSARVSQEHEDVTNMSLTFANGMFASIHSSWLNPNKVREMTIVGSKRMILYDDVQPAEKIRVYDKRVEAPPHYDSFAEFRYSYHYGAITSPYIGQVEPLRVECEHFLECIRGGRKPDSGGLEGLQVVQVLEAATESLKNGGARVDIDFGAKGSSAHG
jgi:predicted dehydrogenase